MKKLKISKRLSAGIGAISEIVNSIGDVTKSFINEALEEKNIQRKKDEITRQNNVNSAFNISQSLAGQHDVEKQFTNLYTYKQGGIKRKKCINGFALNNPINFDFNINTVGFGKDSKNFGQKYMEEHPYNLNDNLNNKVTIFNNTTSTNATDTVLQSPQYNSSFVSSFLEIMDSLKGFDDKYYDFGHVEKQATLPTFSNIKKGRDDTSKNTNFQIPTPTIGQINGFNTKPTTNNGSPVAFGNLSYSDRLRYAKYGLIHRLNH